MSGRVVKTPSAKSDLREIAAYLRRTDPRAAPRFLDDAAETFARLAERPGIGEPYDPDTPEFQGVRCQILGTFRTYVVIYREEARGVRILRVLHGSRDVRGVLDRQFGVERDAEE